MGHKSTFDFFGTAPKQFQSVPAHELLGLHPATFDRLYPGRFIPIYPPTQTDSNDFGIHVNYVLNKKQFTHVIATIQRQSDELPAMILKHYEERINTAYNLLHGDLQEEMMHCIHTANSVSDALVDNLIPDATSLLKQHQKAQKRMLKVLRDVIGDIYSYDSLNQPYKLVESIQMMVHRKNARDSSILFQFKHNLQDDPLLDTITSQIFLDTLNELLLNVSKHSKATECLIRVYADEKRIFCTVSDNGIGFDSQSVTNRGLSIESYRMQSIEGDLSIRTGKEGTQVEIHVPLPGAIT